MLGPMSTTPGPRITPIPPREWPEGMRGAMAAMRPPNPRHPFPVQGGNRPKALNVLGTFAHHPDLATAYHTLTGHALFGTTLTTRQREVLVLRVAAVRGAEYEWRQHVILAHDAGLTPEEIERIAAGPEAEGHEPFDRAMVRAVDELIADATISEETWTALAAELDDQQLLDLMVTVGIYDCLAMVMRATQIEIDDDLLNWK
jgi:alkylhydroperoxidase family enzyme